MVPRLATGSLMVIVKVSLSDFHRCYLHRVYVIAVVWLTVGVPEMTPFDNTKPAGRVGSISQVATLPPVLLATIFVMAVPLVNV